VSWACGITEGEVVEISLLDDLGVAEDDDEAELRFTEDGIPIEPFNLRAEKAAGFFDAEGNYVAYRGEEDTDAWLETLPGTWFLKSAQNETRHNASKHIFQRLAVFPE
jgi:hypothetical protein